MESPRSRKGFFPAVSAMEEESSIRVAVRVRPFSKRELQARARRIIEMEGNTTTITDPTMYLQEDAGCLEDLDLWQTRFTFDRCFWSCDEDNVHNKRATQVDIFDTYGPWIIENAVKGFNCSLFAYGQTGSGKSHTMMGSSVDISEQSEAGFIPRLCNGIFEEINKAGEHEFRVEASYFEIYNERVFDLLNAKSKTDVPASLRVREHPNTGAYVEDLLTIAVNSHEEIEELLKQGATARRVAETRMNKESSRSHAVFQLLLRCYKMDDENKVEQVSKLYLVDLAGSERVSASGATGARLKEAANINRSLSALSDVIKALTSTKSIENGGKQFVPYRNSSLTWLLKESLGGNAKTVMLATVSPDATNYQESLSTLKYAERAKKIVNKARINKESKEALVNSLQKEIKALREQLARYEDLQGDGSSVVSEEEAQQHRQRSNLLVRLESQTKLMDSLSTSWEEKRQHAENHFASLEDQNKKLKIEKDRMEEEMQKLQDEKRALESREVEEEKRKQERQQRHRLQIEQQRLRRKSDHSKLLDSQRELEEARARILELEEALHKSNEEKQAFAKALSLEKKSALDTQQKFERNLNKEKQRLQLRESRLENLYRVILEHQASIEPEKAETELNQRVAEQEEDKTEEEEKVDIESTLKNQLQRLKDLQKRTSETENVQSQTRRLMTILRNLSLEEFVDKIVQNVQADASFIESFLGAHHSTSTVNDNGNLCPELDKLKSELKSVKEELALKSKEVATAQSSKAKLEEVLNSELRRKRAELEEKELVLQGELCDCKALLKDNENTVAQLHSTLRELEERKDELEETACAASTRAKESRIKVQSLEDIIDGLKSSFAEKDLEIEELEEQLKSQAQLFEIEKTSFASLKKEILDKDKKLEDLQKRIHDAEAKHRDEMKNLEAAVSTAQEEKNSLAIQVQTKSAERDKWRFSEMEAVKTKSRLELEIVAMKDELAELKEREEILQSEQISLKEECFRLKQELEERERAASEAALVLQRNLEDANQEISTLKQQVVNERVAFDQIFKAQAEILDCNAFGQAGLPRPRTASPSAARRPF